jgi:hypothetical protein
VDSELKISPYSITAVLSGAGNFEVAVAYKDHFTFKFRKIDAFTYSRKPLAAPSRGPSFRHRPREI